MARLTRFAALVIALFLTTAATAEGRPHRGGGTVRFVSPTEFVNEGTATHVGRFREEGDVQSFPTDNPTMVSLVGVSTLTAANGDEIFVEISGVLDLTTGELEGMVEYVGGTGRFADVSGTLVLFGRQNADGTFSIDVEGTIDY